MRPRLELPNGIDALGQRKTQTGHDEARSKTKVFLNIRPGQTRRQSLSHQFGQRQTEKKDQSQLEGEEEEDGQPNDRHDALSLRSEIEISRSAYSLMQGFKVADFPFQGWLSNPSPERRIRRSAYGNFAHENKAGGVSSTTEEKHRHEGCWIQLFSSSYFASRIPR
mmetsp:Transcript_990/g.2122  ORF Transcript_990/g.2122 Transcript_990/m.2122 type:complete len:166 (-) Transcript_990:2237-2734(-)